MFSKRIFIPVVTLLLIGASVTYLFSKREPRKQEAPEITTTTPTATPIKMLTWIDEAGFSFKYPEGTSIDYHPDDKKNYANITLVFPSNKTAQIIMTDNTNKNLDAWAGENSALDTTLDGRPAKKIFKDGQEIIACIDNDVLVTIAGNDASDIIKSWTFIYPTPTIIAKSTNTDNDTGSILEEY
ncbi:MAG: hypothetical protein UW41_C0009G0030 [Candidatus Collierbacteria bacterium GW2011_GWC2_44_18]|uniref:Uncharacterized protein n=1 Tax=Candidatus Collierbacteria bacterium GW2011_GWC2_44_18 TaxID=1618392 RepID=A0A0G1HRF3_9BACT|nr:MAG: hypothetical protein UW41_C0009G0030 [Candidatus Collierbacteria bacterium GW2011_GWC2_44_18]